jgi:hypothetical protein
MPDDPFAIDLQSLAFGTTDPASNPRFLLACIQSHRSQGNALSTGLVAAIMAHLIEREVERESAGADIGCDHGLLGRMETIINILTQQAAELRSLHERLAALEDQHRGLERWN